MKRKMNSTTNSPSWPTAPKGRRGRKRASEEVLDHVLETDELSAFSDHDHASDEHAAMPDQAGHLEGVGEGEAYSGDALELYLRQMGSISMLSREEEVELADRLETRRRRYRHAAFGNAGILRQVIDTFEQIRAGQLSLDRSVDVVPSQGLTSERIRRQMPHHGGKLVRLLDEAAEQFQKILRVGKPGPRAAIRRAWR